MKERHRLRLEARGLAHAFDPIVQFPMESSSRIGPSGTGPLYAFFFRNDYAVGAWAIAAAAGLILLGWRVRRFFCQAFCPIGATSDLVVKAIGKSIRAG